MTDLLKPAVRDFRSNLALTAGAGAGKTTTLVEFYVSLVLGEVGDLGSIDCSRILAVTYTNKAAQELKDRIRQAMTERLNAAAGDQADRLAQELDRLEQAPVGTIHGFCSGLLREHALEAGIDPGFVIAEGRDLLAEAVFGTVIKLLDQADPDATLLIKHLPFGDDNGGLISTLMYSLNLCRSMGYAPDWMAGQIRSGQAEPDRRLSEIDRQFFQVINALGRVDVKPTTKTYPVLQEVVAKAYNQPLTEELADWLEPRLGKLQGKANESKKKLKEIIQTWRLLEAEPLGRELGLALARLLAKVDQAYAETKRDQGCLDHDDLQLLARDLLFGNLEVRRQVKDRLQLIIVDESQDANPLQWQIINCLREVRNEHRPLTPDQDPAVELNLDDRRLLVVGDVKQSIYRFRGAEVADFRRMVDQFEQGSGGEVCCLDHNYRSRPGLVEFFNAFFDRCFGPAGEDYQAAYTEADCQACHRPGEAAGLVELLVSPGKGESADWIQLEAEAVAARLERLIADQPEALLTDRRPRLLWGHVAVLFRTMAQMRAFEAAFRRRGVPYRVVKSGGGLDEPEIIDLVNLLEYLTRPDDRLLLASLLRSPLVGLDDDSLAIIAFGDGPGQVGQGLEKCAGPAAELRPTGLPADQLLKLDRFNELISTLIEVKDRLAPADLISLAMEQTDLAAVYLAGFQGDQKLARIQSLIETVRRLSAREAPLLSDVVERLRPLTSQPATDVEPPADSDLDAITLMTIHKAKGLQFPVVVVARSGRTRRPPDPIILARPGMGLGLKFKQPGRTGWRQTWSHSELLNQERSREEAENKRLFYVAATRAEDLLIFSGMREAKNDDSSWRAQLEAFAESDDRGFVQTISLGPETGPSAKPADSTGPLLSAEEVDRVVDRVFGRPDYGQLLEYSVSQLEDLDFCPACSCSNA